MMDWDWYSATVPAGPEQVLDVFEGYCGLDRIRSDRGLHSYTHGALAATESGETIARWFWGGVNGENVHIQASGVPTPGVVALVRQEWPQHRVSRSDSRVDWSHAKAWRWASRICIQVARAHGVRMSTVGDWIEGQAGRTLYLGSKTSRVQIRLYEKGKQLGVDPNWVRLEVQVRPTGDGKSHMAAAEPAQLMQSTAWTSEIAALVDVPKLQAVRVRDPWTESDDERALRFMCRQYGSVLSRKASTLGGWPQLGEFLRAAVMPGKGGRVH